MADDREIARAIADAVRLERTRPATDRSTAHFTTGTVQSLNVADSYAEVLLDEDIAGGSSSCQVVAPVRAGDRVVVLLVPPAGAYVLGALGALSTDGAGFAWAGTTDGAGRVAVPHGRPYVPAWAVPTMQSLAFAQAESIDDTSVTVRVHHTDGSGTANLVAVTGFMVVGL